MAQLRKLAPAGNFDTIGDDAALERRSGAHADVIPEDTVGDSRRRFDNRPLSDLRRIAFGLADRQARVEIVGGRADVPEIGVAQERADVAQILFDELLVQNADAFRRLVQRQPREGRRMRDLHADDVIRAHARPRRHDAVESARRIDDQAAIAVGTVDWE